jgi:hypothetical protein
MSPWPSPGLATFRSYCAGSVSIGRVGSESITVRRSQAAQKVAALQASHGDLASLSADVTQAAAGWNAAPQIAGFHLVFNLPAFLSVMALTFILGARDSRERAGLIRPW